MKSLAVEIKSFITSFQLSLDLIGVSIHALVALAAVHCCDDEQHQSTVVATCTDWIKEIFYKCEAKLNAYVCYDNSMAFQGSTNETELSRVIFTAGEICMVGFTPNEEFNTKHTRAAIEGGNSNESIQGLCVRPSNRLTRLVQSLIPFTLPNINGSSTSKEVSHVLRAHAFVAFGKICLRDEALVKESINIFAQELHQSGSKSNVAVKSNALLVLGDFCVRYTHLVEKFIPLMASCLQDDVNDKAESETSIVRQHAILLLSNLILQDYIKWKGVLFYRFLIAVASKDAAVANMARILLSGPLLTKDPTLFHHNFIDAVFILNGSTSHPMYAAVRRGSVGAQDLSSTNIVGSLKVDNAEKRMEIYNFLLDHLTDAEKIGVTARLAKEVLCSATDASGSLSRAAAAPGGVTKESNDILYGSYNVLSDCFTVLTNSRLSVGKSRKTDPSDEGDDMNMSMASLGPNSAQLSSMKGKLLSTISRKHLIETMFPILCNLKVILENSRSPLLKDLMQYMVYIFRQFKNEINETLASDPTLLHEIQYDTRKFEKSQSQILINEVIVGEDLEIAA